VLFIHGFRGDHHGLQAVAGALADLTVVSPDLPGFGKSAELEHHDLSSYSDWLIDFCTSTGPYDLVVGHSFGTLVVTKAISNGLSTKKVCLINPITTRGNTSKSLSNRLAEIYYRIGKNKIFGSWLMSSGLVTRSMSIGLTKAKDRRTRSFIEGFHAANSGSVFDYADALTGSILLIAGSQDAVAPISEQKRLNEVLPNSELLVLKRVGHLSHYERPVEIATAITNFLETH
jgi:pimeloyl-ACP methyl ester carboxylesterase